MTIAEKTNSSVYKSKFMTYKEGLSSNQVLDFLASK